MVLYSKEKHVSLEALCLHGPNTVSFQLVTGRQRWHVVGCYITSTGASTIEEVVAAIGRRPQGSNLLVAINFNKDLSKSEGSTRAEDITEALVSARL